MLTKSVFNDANAIDTKVEYLLTLILIKLFGFVSVVDTLTLKIISFNSFPVLPFAIKFAFQRPTLLDDVTSRAAGFIVSKRL